MDQWKICTSLNECATRYGRHSLLQINGQWPLTAVVEFNFPPVLILLPNRMILNNSHESREWNQTGFRLCAPMWLKAKPLHLVYSPANWRSRIPPCRNEKSSTQTSKLLSNSWLLANLRHWGWQLDSSQWCLFLVWLFSPVPFACRTQFQSAHVHWVYRSFCYHYYGQPVWMCSDREQCAIKSRQQYAQGTMCNYILKKIFHGFLLPFFYIFRIPSTHPSIWVSCRCSLHAMAEIL